MILDAVRSMTKDQADIVLATRRWKVYPFEKYYDMGVMAATGIVCEVLDRRIELLHGIMNDSKTGLHYYDAYMEINALWKAKDGILCALGYNGTPESEDVVKGDDNGDDGVRS